MDLAEFLIARIAEDETTAREAHYEGQRWYSEEETVDRWPEICDCGCPVMYAANRKIEAQHIATWDPARVLAESEAKRRIVEQLAPIAAETWDVDLYETLRLLALPYADHPDYQPEWAPTVAV